MTGVDIPVEGKKKEGEKEGHEKVVYKRQESGVGEHNPVSVSRTGLFDTRVSDVCPSFSLSLSLCVRLPHPLHT